MDEQSLSKQARIEYIDLFRGIGIILMVMGHVGFGSFFDRWIHIFHMPMFFIISGYFWKDHPFSTMLKKKARTLLIPYITFGLIHIIIHFIRIGNIDAHAFYLLLWENTAEGGVPIAGALWFLTAMFFSEVLFWCIQKINVSDNWKNIIICLITISGMACATYLPFRLPWAFDVGMVGVGLYQIGSMLKGKWSKLLNLNPYISLLGFVVFSALGFMNGYVNIRQGLYSVWPLFGINAIGLTISFWNLSRLLYYWASEKKLLDRLLAWIRGIGRDSIIYLCFNQLMILIAAYLVKVLLPSDGGIVLLVKKAVILIICLIELYLAQIIIMKTKLKNLIGK